jgi:hypothetical protein
MKTIVKKECELCKKPLTKASNCSVKEWEGKRFCSISCSKTGNKNRLGISYPAWNKGIVSPFVENLSASWKGDNVGYSGIHKWVIKWKGKPKMCEKCGRTDLEGHNFHWANIDHKYRRVLDDYIRLCVQCHTDYDKDNNLK